MLLLHLVVTSPLTPAPRDFWWTGTYPVRKLALTYWARWFYDLIIRFVKPHGLSWVGWTRFKETPVNLIGAFEQKQAVCSAMCVCLNCSFSWLFSPPISVFLIDFAKSLCNFWQLFLCFCILHFFVLSSVFRCFVSPYTWFSTLVYSFSRKMTFLMAFNRQVNICCRFLDIPLLWIHRLK